MESEINYLKSIKYRHTTSEKNYNTDKTQEAAFDKIERDEYILKVEKSRKVDKRDSKL